MIMASVCLAGIKIGGILLGLSPFECIFYSSLVTVLYSTVGGLRGVIYTDLIQFFVAMVGSIWATYYIINLEEIGGLGTMLSHSSVVDKVSFFPSADNTEQFLIVLIIPIAVQWWAVWYPGAEPGGGGYIAQRMLSAKNEKNAIYRFLNEAVKFKKVDYLGEPNALREYIHAEERNLDSFLGNANQKLKRVE